MKNIINTLKNSVKSCTMGKALLIMLLLSAFCVFLEGFTYSGHILSGEASLFICPLLLLFNALPMFLIMCIAYSLTNKIWIGFFTAVLPLNILLTVNYFKVYFRSESLTLHDFSLFSEATNIMKGYDFPIPYSMIFAVVLSILMFVFVKKIGDKKAKFKHRMILLVVSVISVTVSYAFLYRSEDLYDALPSFANEFNDISLAANKGFVYTFLSKTSAYEYKKPKGYDAEKMIMEKLDETEMPETPVNVIAIMSEAFFDMEACENAEFFEGQNPTPNLTRLRNDALWGSILVPGYAGSTASTEFEFLTGINISLIDSSMPVVYKTHVTEDAYSIARLFKNMGYTTEAMHAGNEWFYNRKAVYPRLGFDAVHFKEGFDYTNDDLVNYYVSDEVTADKIISEYEDYLNSGGNNGYFSFTVTIQNHGPYNTKKPETIRLKRPDMIDDTGYNTLLNYANGLYDADKLLGRVCDYTDSIDAPTVVVFFGDHLPYFDAEGKNLTYLGLDVNSSTPTATENKYLTPYMIYGNDAFKAMQKANNKEIMTGKTQNISSSYLSSFLLNYMGINSPYFNEIGKISDNISEISGTFYVSDGEYLSILNTEQSKALDNYKQLSYWALRDYKKN